MMNSALKELQTIPGVGKSIARDLFNINIRSVSDLKKADPEELYKRITQFYKARQDVCLLYVMRCAVYFASNENHDQDKLNWWYWKNRETDSSGDIVSASRRIILMFILKIRLARLF